VNANKTFDKRTHKAFHTRTQQHHGWGRAILVQVYYGLFIALSMLKTKNRQECEKQTLFLLSLATGHTPQQ